MPQRHIDGWGAMRPCERKDVSERRFGRIASLVELPIRQQCRCFRALQGLVLTRSTKGDLSDIDEGFLAIFLGIVGSGCAIDTPVTRCSTLSRRPRCQHNYRAHTGLVLVLADRKSTRLNSSH